MNGTTDINPDTGLPALPDGQWWRVSEHADHVLLSIMRRVDKRGLFGGTRIVEEAVVTEKVRGNGNPYYTHPKWLDEDHILDTAKRMLRDTAEAKHRATLYGDYPPKRLGETK